MSASGARPGVRFGSAVKWATVMSWGQEGLSTVTTFLLAHLLGPSEFGIVVIALAFIGFIELLAAQGFHGSIVQRRELDDIDLDSIFWVTLGLGCIFALACIAASGFVADFYSLPILAPLIQVGSLAVLARALTVVQEAKLTREMDFKSLAMRTNLSVIAGAAVGIGMALAGLGAWAIIGQYLTRSIVGLAVLWRAAHWIPRFRFHRVHTREMTVFSAKYFPATLFDFFGSQAEPMIMGRFFDPAAVGLYRLAIRIVDLAIMLVTRALWYVSFPYFAEARGDRDRMRARVTECVGAATQFALPLLCLVALESPRLVALIGPEWGQAASAIRILVIYGMLRSLVLFAGPLLLSAGKPHLQSVMMGVQCGALCAGVALTGYFLRSADPAAQVSGMAWIRVAVYFAVFLPLSMYFMVKTAGVTLRGLLGASLPGVAAALGAAAVDRVLAIPADFGPIGLAIRAGLAMMVAFGILVALRPELSASFIGRFRPAVPAGQPSQGK